MELRHLRCFVIVVVLASLPAAAPGAEPSRPWWRRALAAPDDAMSLLSWPIKKGAIWAEDVNLPERLYDVIYFNDERTAGWFPNFSFGGEIQSAVGIKLFHRDLLGGKEEIELSTLFQTNDFEEKRVGVRYYDPSLWGSSFDGLVQVDYQEDNDEDFFVDIEPDGEFRFGDDTHEHDDTTFKLTRVFSRLESAYRPAKGLRVGLAFVPLYGDVEEGGGAEPQIPRVIDGFGGPTVLLGGDSFVEWDARDSANRPHEGWYARVSGGAWSGVDGETTTGRDYAYARYGFDLRRHQPTFRTDRSLVLRASLDRVETIDGKAVPFWELPNLDEDHALRGFRRHRFRDRGALLFNAEYRWPIWDTWDGYAFVDEGQVFHDYSDVDFDRFRWSAGGGVLVFTEAGFVLRLEYAYSEERQAARFVLVQAF